jgi:hypothetical protein
VACNSSSRLSEVAADFELMTLSWSIYRPATVSPSPEK